MSKVASAFNYKIYRISEERIVEVDFSSLLPEKVLTKMSKIEFRCYLKEIKNREIPLSKQEALLIKKLDKRIRNKETVRKSKKRFKEEFLIEKKNYESLYENYLSLLNRNNDLLKILEECKCHDTHLMEIKNEMSCNEHKFTDFQL